MVGGWMKNEPIPPIKWKEVVPPAVFRKLYRPLGEIAFTFADLEAEVTDALTTILGTTWREGAAIESLVQNFSARIELFYFVAISAATPHNQLAVMTAASRSEKERRRYEAYGQIRELAAAIYTDLQQANADRNNLLHGQWTGLGTGGTYSKERVSAREGKLTDIPVRGITVELLRDQAQFFVSLRMRVADWRMRFKRREHSHLWPPPLPEKYLLRSPLGRLIQAHRSEAKRLQRAASKR